MLVTCWSIQTVCISLRALETQQLHNCKNSPNNKLTRHVSLCSQNMSNERVSRSGCSCSLASLHYVISVPWMKGSVHSNVVLYNLPVAPQYFKSLQGRFWWFLTTHSKVLTEASMEDGIILLTAGRSTAPPAYCTAVCCCMLNASVTDCCWWHRPATVTASSETPAGSSDNKHTPHACIIILFRKCCSRCWIQPYDCIIIHFVELICVFKFC